MKNIRNKNAPPNADLVQVYLSSSWDIVTDVYNELANLTELAEALEAGELTGYLQQTDINTLAELNAIVADATFGDFATQAQAEAGSDNTTTMTPLRVAQAIAILAAGYKNTFDGATPPTVTDDVNAGYSVGSVWIDIVASPHESYRCSDNTAGAAVWLHTTVTSDDLATVALSGDSDDLIQGAAQLLMTAAERSKLAAIEASATADQTDNEILTAYNNQVAAASQGEMEAGTEAAIKTMSPLRVAQAIAALGGGGGGGVSWSYSTISAAVAAGTGTVFHDMAATVTATLPAAPTLNDTVWISNNDNSSYNVQITAGGSNEIREENTTGIPTLTLLPGETALLVCQDAGATKKWGLGRMSATSGGGGLAVEFKTANFTAVAGKKYFVDSSGGAVAVTLPVGVDLDNIKIADIGHAAATFNITLTPNGAETIDNDTSFVIDQNEGDVDIGYNDTDSNWEVSADGSPDLVNVNDFVTGFSDINAQTGTTYEFVEQDLVDCVTANNASASTYDIPDSLGSNGDTLNLYNTGAGVVTIEMAGTDTLDTSDNSCAQYKAITMLKVSATKWAVIGGSA